MPATTGLGRVLRALWAEGPQSSDELAIPVGGKVWEPGRYERAVLDAIAGGQVIQRRRPL